MAVKQVGKQAMSYISDKQNKAATLKESIINAAEDCNLVMKELVKVEIDKAKQESGAKDEPKINVQDLKNAEKLVLDIEGRE